MSTNFKFESNVKNTKENVKKYIESALSEIGKFVVAESQLRTPVLNGDLRRGASYKVDVKNKVVRVGSNVPYDAAVEFGDSRHAAKPHWTPAVQENVSEIQGIVSKHLGKVGG